MSILRPNRRRDRNKDPLGLEFMRWVKLQCCCVCYAVVWKRVLAEGSEVSWRHVRGLSEAAHIGGNIGSKPSNWSVLPLCVRHHRDGRESQEALKRRFGQHWGINEEEVIAVLVARFRELNPEKFETAEEPPQGEAVCQN